MTNAMNLSKNYPEIKPPAERQHALDSLRGIAALLVVFHHLVLAYRPHDNSFLFTFVHDIGRSCVLLFFVLSGFALTCALRGRQTYWQYIIRRICRIYLPFAAAIALSVTLYFIIMPEPVSVFTPWFNSGYSFPVNFKAVARHLAMTGKPQDIFLDNPMWSLVYEMRISIVFPLMAIIVGKAPKLSAILAFIVYPIALYACTGPHWVEPFMGKTLRMSLFYTIYFACFFVVGILIANYSDHVKRFFGRLGLLPVLLISIVAAVGFSISLFDIGIGFGSAIVICLAISRDGFKRFLLIKPLELLGRISYSLYLTHLLIIMAMFHLLHDQMNSLSLILLTLTSSLVFSYGFYRVVELPSLNLGRTLAGLKKQTLAVPADQ